MKNTKESVLPIPQPYPHYKPSHVEWLGNVPAHWEVRRLKFAARIIAGQSPPSEIVFQYSDRFPFLQGNAEFGLVSPTPRLACEEPSKWARAGDILLSVRAPVGALNIADQMYGIGRGLCAITPSADLTRRFAYYTLRTAKAGLDRASTGSTYDAVTVGDVGGLPFPLPPLPEQRAIVRYLDHVDDRIRRYVSAKEKLIAVLEEERQAVIHRAVTRGLDPNVRLKPSGVEWLGEVPAHWEVRRLRTVVEMRVSNVDKHIRDNELPVRLCNYVDVYKNDRITRAISFMNATATKDEIEKFRLHQDDVLITKDSETWDDIGVPALVTEPAHDLIAGYHLALLRPYRTMLGRYLSRSLQSKMVSCQFHVEAKGVTRYGLSQGGIKSIHVPLPPLSEQTAIVEHLDKTTTAIDDAISRARRRIELLREYRTRLIADVVTGKLDVRETTANLPDETAQ